MELDADKVVVAAVSEAVQALLLGDRERAEATLAGIVVARPGLDTSALTAQKATPGSKRTSVPAAAQMAVYRRDNFTCRYCGRQTLFTPVVRLLSAMCPSVLPYHPHWKRSECHDIYWVYTVSLEHVIPVAAGGSNEPDNIATACYSCNDRKNSWSAEQLGWKLRAPVAGGWDGLSSSYPALYGAYIQGRAASAEGYFRQWLRVCGTP